MIGFRRGAFFFFLGGEGLRALGDFDGLLFMARWYRPAV